MKKLIVIIFALALTTTGCATLTSDPLTPIAISASDGSNGRCVLTNKRGSWEVDVPSTVYVRRSDDVLRYDLETEDGHKAVGSIPSRIGAKIIASAVFLDLGIVDAITDKHREYPPSFVIPIKKFSPNDMTNNAPSPLQETGETEETEETPSVSPTLARFSSDGSNIYHILTCPKLGTGTLVKFATSQEAQDAGGLPCSHCNS
jgi:hypothetical protein|tara:strand:- start:69 stop:677 length:609 start_codon:yes stop_codon:yes gene_type:complete